MSGAWLKVRHLRKADNRETPVWSAVGQHFRFPLFRREDRVSFGVKSFGDAIGVGFCTRICGLGIFRDHRGLRAMLRILL